MGRLVDKNGRFNRIFVFRGGLQVRLISFSKDCKALHTVPTLNRPKV